MTRCKHAFDNIAAAGRLGFVGKLMVRRASRPSSAGTADPPPQSGVFRRGLVVLCLVMTSIATASDAPPDPFIQTVANIRPSILAVGSYHFKSTPTGQYFGTGFVVTDGNTLVTNAHVVAAITKSKLLDHMTVFEPDTRPRQGRRAVLLAQDVFHDVAVLRFAGPPIKAVQVDVTTVPLQGQTVGIVGYPIGMRLGVVPAVHRGVVAAIVKAVRPLPKGAKMTSELAKAIRHPFLIYQLDLTVLPGNSGSPVFNVRSGKVIGIINKTLAAKTREHLLTNPSGIAYAVETRWIDRLLKRSLAGNTRDHEKEHTGDRP